MATIRQSESSFVVKNDILAIDDYAIEGVINGAGNFVPTGGTKQGIGKPYNETPYKSVNFDSKGNAISAATLLSSAQIIAILGYTPVPESRTLTINGVTYDLSADRTWTISGTVYGLPSVLAVDAKTNEIPITSNNLYSSLLLNNSFAKLIFNNGTTVNNIIDLNSSGSIALDSFIINSNGSASVNGSFPILSGYGGSFEASYLCASTGIRTTGDLQFNASGVSKIASNIGFDLLFTGSHYNFSGLTPLTLGYFDSSNNLVSLGIGSGLSVSSGNLVATGGGSGTVTSVDLSMPSAFSISGNPITTSGTIAVTAIGTTAQYIDGTGALQTFPSLTGYVPYTGATANVVLGLHSLFASSLGATDLISPAITSCGLVYTDTSGNLTIDIADLCWDDTNKYLGVHTSAPNYPIDIHNLANNMLALNNTGTGSSFILFQQTATTKWKVGNNNSVSNTFEIQNIGTLSIPITIDGTTNDVKLISNINLDNQTASTIASFDASKNVVSLPLTIYPSLVELSHVKGLTSSVQTQINAKFTTPTGTTSQYLRGDGSLASFPSIPSVGTWGALNYPAWVSGTPFVKMTAAGTFSLDTSTYLTDNQTITLSGEASGSGTTSIAVTLGNSSVIGKVLTGYTSGAGVVASTDTILQAIQKLNGNTVVATNAESSQSRVLSAAVSLTTSTPANVTATALTLAAGTWDISAMGGFLVGTSTSVLTSIVAISITSATLPSNDSYAVPNANGEVMAKTNQTATGIVQTTGSAYTISIPQYRFTFAAPVTLYLVASAVFLASTLKAYGSIRAIPVKQ